MITVCLREICPKCNNYLVYECEVEKPPKKSCLGCSYEETLPEKIKTLLARTASNA